MSFQTLRVFRRRGLYHTHTHTHTHVVKPFPLVHYDVGKTKFDIIAALRFVFGGAFRTAIEQNTKRNAKQRGQRSIGRRERENAVGAKPRGVLTSVKRKSLKIEPVEERNEQPRAR